MTSRRFVFAACLFCSMLTGVAAAEAGPANRPEAPTVASPVDTASPSPGPERLELGIALDTEEGLIGSVYAGKNDLIPGVFTFATFRNTRETRRGQVGLFKQDAPGTNIDAGLDLNYGRDAYDDQGYRQTNVSIEPYLQFRTGRRGTLTTALGYRRVTLNGIAADAPPSFHRDERTSQGLYARLSYVLNDLVRTKRLRLDVGMDTHFYNLDSTSRTFVQAEAWSRGRLDLIADDLHLLNVVRVGYLRRLDGRPLRLADRFFIGGANLRGFEARHVGPREGRYFIGGERYATASLDLVKKVGSAWGSPLSMGAFVDVGSLWGVDAAGPGQSGIGANLRVSAGVAVTLAVARVPVSLYVAKPVRKEPQDVEQNFGMSASMRF